MSILVTTTMIGRLSFKQSSRCAIHEPGLLTLSAVLKSVGVVDFTERCPSPQSAAMQTIVQCGFHDTKVRILDFEYRAKPGESDKKINRAAEA